MRHYVETFSMPDGSRKWMRVKETPEMQEVYIFDPMSRHKRQMEVINKIREQLRNHHITETVGDTVITTEGRSGLFVVKVRGQKPFRFTRVLYGVTEWAVAMVAHQEAVGIVRLRNTNPKPKVEVRR